MLGAEGLGRGCSAPPVEAPRLLGAGLGWAAVAYGAIL